MFDRRSIIASALFAPALLTSALAATTAAPAVRVDVSRLMQLSLGANAARIKAAMERELADVGADLRRRGATLVVRVLGVNMPSFAGGTSGMGGGGAYDSLESEATVLGADGRVVATYPILSSSSAGAAGTWYAQDIDALRVDAVVRTNAAWIKRYVGG